MASTLSLKEVMKPHVWHTSTWISLSGIETLQSGKLYPMGKMVVHLPPPPDYNGHNYLGIGSMSWKFATLVYTYNTEVLTQFHIQLVPATKFQYVNSPFFILTHYMFRPLRAILRWDIQLMFPRTILTTTDPLHVYNLRMSISVLRPVVPNTCYQT
jgi:hypothetical protein